VKRAQRQQDPLDSVIVSDEFVQLLSHWQSVVAEKWERYCDEEFSRLQDGERKK